MVPGTTDKEIVMDDEQRLDLAQSILDQHFGLNFDGVAGCATCRGATARGVTWPCPPARLAAQVKEEVLSR